MTYSVSTTSGSSTYAVTNTAVNNELDITLIGKGYLGYGQALNTNLVKLLENFANTSQPSKPIAGQLWYDTTSNLLKVYNGASFTSIGGGAGAFTTLTATSGYHGAASGPLNGTLGATTPNSVVATSVVATSVTTTSGGQIIGYLTGVIGANSANAGTFTTLTATSGYQGAASGPLNGTLGATTPNSVVATSVTTTSGGQVTGYLTGVIGANTANVGTFTTLTATSGYQGAASGPLNGTLGATTPNSVVATSVTTTSGGQITGYLKGAIGANTANSGVFTSVTTTSGGQVTGYMTGVIGANTANTGAFTTITASTSITAGAIQLWAANNTITGATISGASSGATGPLNGTLGATTPNSVVATSITTTSAGQITGYHTGAIGANTANSGAFTTLTSSSQTGLANTAVTGLYTTNGVFWANGTAWSSGGSLISSATAPSTPALGDHWYDTSSDVLYIRINDGVTALWLDISTIPNTFGNLVVISNITTGNLITTSGGQLIGYHTGPIGANTANTGAFTTISVNSSTVGITNAGSSGVGNIGASGATFNTVFAKATTAQYADLAERYLSDDNYEPGTVVVFGGESEITATIKSHDTRIAGVISTNPAYLMNDAGQEGIWLPVALQGRVLCKVKGPVSKGDLVVSSDIAGAAERMNKALYEPGTVIGKSLSTINTNEIQSIEVVVGRL